MPFKFFLIYLFFDASRIQEFVKILGALQLQKIFAVLALAGLFFSPALRNDLKKNLMSTQSKVLMFLVFWMLLSVPFSVWPGESFRYITGSLWKSLLICVLILLYGSPPGNLRRIISAYFLGIIFLGVFSLFLGNINAMGVDTSYDRNEVAMQFVVMLPLAFWQARSSGRISKICAVLVCLLAPIVVVGSQSRGGFLGMAAVFAILLFQSGRFSIKSISIGLFIVVGFFAGLYFLAGPAYLERLQTLLNPSEDYNVTSNVGRIAVWERGIGMIFSNPLLGIGINGFAFAEGLSHLSTGGKWSAAHNSFLQVTAELGFPGLICYFYIIYSFLKNAARSSIAAAEAIKGNDNQYHANIKRAIMGSWVGFSITGFFLSMAFSQVFFFLFAVSCLLLGFKSYQDNPEWKA